MDVTRLIKGMNLIQKVKYEMQQNLEYHNQSVKIPIKDLKLLLELAESNQYRLDLENAMKISDLEGKLAVQDSLITEFYNQILREKKRRTGKQEV